jgi:hypothetical protein
MSNSLSIPTVTEAFRSLLDDACSESGVSGAIATKVRPTPLNNIGQPGGLPSAGVNVYLYKVSPNTAFRNSDNPSRRSDGSVMKPSRSAYDLSYLLTFYGDENLFEPQMVLGSVLRRLHSEPILSPERIKGAGDTVKLVYPLLTPDLLLEVEKVKLGIVPLSLEELSKLWQVFFQIPYSLSLAYQAEVVFVDGKEIAKPTLPVRSRNVYVRSFRHPSIEALLSQKDLNQPILSGQPVVKGDILVLSGRQLKGDANLVRLDDIETTPIDVTDTRVRFKVDEPPFVADTLRAGVHGVQVIQQIPMGTPETDHKGFESNVAAFVLRPTITVPPPVVTSSVDSNGVTWYETDLTVNFIPKVALGQHVLLLLNEYNPPSNRSAYAYQYDLTPVPYPPGPPLPSLTVHIKLSTPADYLVRVQVDGAESLLDSGPDPLHPFYSGPKVTIA